MQNAYLFYSSVQNPLYEPSREQLAQRDALTEAFEDEEKRDEERTGQRYTRLRSIHDIRWLSRYQVMDKFIKMLPQIMWDFYRAKRAEYLGFLRDGQKLIALFATFDIIEKLAEMCKKLQNRYMCVGEAIDYSRQIIDDLEKRYVISGAKQREEGIHQVSPILFCIEDFFFCDG